MPLLLKVIRLASFESLRLNLGTGDTVQSELVSADTSWARIEGEAVREGGYSLGIDLGIINARVVRHHDPTRILAWALQAKCQGG